MKAPFKTTVLISMILLSRVFAGSQSEEPITFFPIQHATMVIQTSDAIIYVDPVGGAEPLAKYAAPDIILITDIHGDHLDAETVSQVKKDDTAVIAPKAVIEQLSDGQILNNGESTTVGNIHIEAIPMYNLTEERLKYHPKGRGNGYVITADEKRIYISGDTEDIPEMRKLKNIDYAFVCMNLPYTMTVEQAASAVLEMKPKVVIPYHFRGSDMEKFKELVSKDEEIEIRMLEWYE